MGQLDQKIRLKYFSHRGLRRLSSPDAAFYYAAQSVCEKNYHSLESEYYQYGYQTFGPLLYGFSRWLAGKLVNEGIRKVFFFARDGYIMREAFHRIPASNQFEDDYLYVSRRSLCVPLLWSVDDEERLSTIAMTRYISMHDLLESVGLNAVEYYPLLEEFGLHPDEVRGSDEFESDNQLRAFLDAIWPSVQQNSKCEYEAARSYLQSKAIPSRVAVVDIGWRGSIQQSFERLIELSGIESEVTGYYLNLSSSMHHNLNMRGYNHDIDNLDEGCDDLRGYIGLIETMFLKPEGSTMKYDQTADGIPYPVLFDYEYGEGDESFEMRSVIELQRGAMSFIEDYVSAGEPWKEFSSEVAFKNLRDFACYPTWDAIEMFGNFRFYNNGTVSKLAGTNKPLFNFSHPTEMKKDLYGSRWRIAFLKRNMRLPLPYLQLFNALMRATL